MRAAWVFAGVGLLATLAGSALWLGTRQVATTPGGASAIAPTALYASSFTDLAGRPQSLGQFQGRVLVLNFWATWCAPCREEMPAFDRVHARWEGRGVQFVGISSEDAPIVQRFATALRISYPLWVGGGEVDELSRRLGNRLKVLPHTAILDEGGRLLENRVGPYTEAELEQRLKAFTAKVR